MQTKPNLLLKRIQTLHHTPCYSCDLTGRRRETWLHNRFAQPRAGTHTFRLLPLSWVPGVCLMLDAPVATGTVELHCLQLPWVRVMHPPVPDPPHYLEPQLPPFGCSSD